MLLCYGHAHRNMAFPRKLSKCVWDARSNLCSSLQWSVSGGSSALFTGKPVMCSASISLVASSLRSEATHIIFFKGSRPSASNQKRCSPRLSEPQSNSMVSCHPADESSHHMSAPLGSQMGCRLLQLVAAPLHCTTPATVGSFGHLQSCPFRPGGVAGHLIACDDGPCTSRSPARSYLFSSFVMAVAVHPS